MCREFYVVMVLSCQVVDLFFYDAGPFCVGVGFIEGLPGDGVAEGEAEGFVVLPHHFAREEDHFDVGLYVEFCPEVGEVIEEAGVLSRDMDGDDVALVAPGLADEGLLPYGVDDPAAFLFPGDQSGGEVEDSLVGGEGLVDDLNIFGVLSMLVDGDEEGLESGDKHKEVVDREDDIGAGLSCNEEQCEPVQSAEGVVGGDKKAA